MAAKGCDEGTSLYFALSCMGKKMVREGGKVV